jgi:hypothetical protein
MEPAERHGQGAEMTSQQAEIVYRRGILANMSQ